MAIITFSDIHLSSGNAGAGGGVVCSPEMAPPEVVPSPAPTDSRGEKMKADSFTLFPRALHGQLNPACTTCIPVSTKEEQDGMRKVSYQKEEV